MSVDRTRLPELGPDVSIRFPSVERRLLSSGLRVWTVEQREMPVLVLLLVLPTGSAGDPSDRPGLAALTADLLDEGSGDRDAIAIHEAIARIGAQLEIDTGYDSTTISLVTLSRFRREAIDLLSDIVFRPRLDEADFARVRELRCNRLAQMRDVPGALAEQAFVEHVFGTHPYGHLSVGTEPSLRAVAVDEVRRFHQERYRPGGALLIAVGEASHGEIVQAVEAATTGLALRDAVAFVEVPPVAIGGEGRRLVLVDRPDAPQSELRIGHLAVARSTPEYHPLVVLNALLGGQFVSRINLNLREDKGYTYGARSTFDWRRAPGPFVVQTSVQTDATAAAISEVLRELAEVGGGRPPTSRELELAQASLTRGFARNFETPEQIARALAQIAVYQLPDSWFDEFVDHVRAVDGDTVADVAHRHVRPADALVTVVGNRSRIEAELARLDFRTTVTVSPPGRG